MTTTLAPTPRFASLKHRNFKILLAGLIASNTGTWMQNVAQGWLVLQLTNSPLWLGLLGLSFAIPMIILPQQLDPSQPQPIEENFDYWKQTILGNNHELAMVRSERRVQEMRTGLESMAQLSQGVLELFKAGQIAPRGIDKLSRSKALLPG